MYKVLNGALENALANPWSTWKWAEWPCTSSGNGGPAALGGSWVECGTQHLSAPCKMHDALLFLGDFWFVKNHVNWTFPCVWLLATFEFFPGHVVMLDQRFCAQSGETKWLSTIQCPCQLRCKQIVILNNYIVQFFIEKFELYLTIYKWYVVFKPINMAPPPNKCFDFLLYF
jgi:hypothetical protein